MLHSAMSPQLRQGQVIAGRFAITQEYGQGGTATVYQALDMQSHQFVALKHLNIPAHLGSHEKSLRIQRFEHEASIMALLQHPHIMGFHQLIQEQDDYYMALEFIPGVNLDRVAEPLRLQPALLLPLIDQVADALEHVHAHGVIHLDIKPENVMVVEQGSHAKLLDFGIARLEGAEISNNQAALVGTLSYMSPEQIQNSRLTHVQSDIYSLGVLMYEIFTGQLPFKGDNQGAAMLMALHHDPTPAIDLNPLIGEDLNQLIMTCMHKRPQHRFANCRQLRQLLKIVCQRSFANPHGLPQTILPAIQMFKAFSLLQEIQELVDKKANGQLMIWTAFEEAGVLFRAGQIISADIKNKNLGLEQSLKDMCCWESGNFLYIPSKTAALSAEPENSDQTERLLSQAWRAQYDYQALWEVYHDNDIPEKVMDPGPRDVLSDLAWTLLDFCNGYVSIAQIFAQLPVKRLEILDALQVLEDRRFIFLERQSR